MKYIKLWPQRQHVDIYYSILLVPICVIKVILFDIFSLFKKFQFQVFHLSEKRD